MSDQISLKFSIYMQVLSQLVQKLQDKLLMGLKLRKNGFLIRVVHHLHEEELDQDERNLLIRAKEKGRDLIKPYKKHCQKLFLGHKKDITQKIWALYEKLDSNQCVYIIIADNTITYIGMHKIKKQE